MALEDVHLLDTNIASASWSQKHTLHTRVRQRLQSIQSDRVFLSTVTLAEVEFGLKIADDIDIDQQREVRRAMYEFKVKAVDRHTATVFAEIRTILFRAYAPRDNRGRRKPIPFIESLKEPISGRELGVQENDLWIVSVAKQYNMVFVTDDRREGMNRIIGAADYQNRTQYWGIQ